MEIWQILILIVVGMLSGWLPRLRRYPRAEVAMLALWGTVLGLAFGALMNVWFWPYVFAAGQSEMYWQPGLGLVIKQADCQAVILYDPHKHVLGNIHCGWR